MPRDVTSRPYHTQGWVTAAEGPPFRRPVARKGLHRYARRNGNWVLVFSAHASHQGAFSRLPCSPPTCAGRGRRLGMGRKPRVPLALHPGLLIFRPYRGLDKTLSHSGSWLLTFCCSQPCCSLRSQGYQGPEPLVRPLCATLREFCSRFGSHGQQLLLTVGLSSRTAHDYRKRRVNRGYRSRRYQRPEPLVSRPSFAFLFNSKLPHSKYLAKLNGYLQRPRRQEFVPAASQELQCPAPSRSR